MRLLEQTKEITRIAVQEALHANKQNPVQAHPPAPEHQQHAPPAPLYPLKEIDVENANSVKEWWRREFNIVTNDIDTIISELKDKKFDHATLKRKYNLLACLLGDMPEYGGKESALRTIATNLLVRLDNLAHGSPCDMTPTELSFCLHLVLTMFMVTIQEKLASKRKLWEGPTGLDILLHTGSLLMLVNVCLSMKSPLAKVREHMTLGNERLPHVNETREVIQGSFKIYVRGFFTSSDPPPPPLPSEKNVRKCPTSGFPRDNVRGHSEVPPSR